MSNLKTIGIMNAIETISYKGHEIGIYYDEYAESPRAWDNLSMIYSNSRRYNPDGLDIDDLMNEIGISEFPGFDNILLQSVMKSMKKVKLST